MAKITFRTYDDVWNMQKQAYTVTDVDGQDVLINVKNPLKHNEHTSVATIEQMPTFFFNLGMIINQPHNVAVNPPSNKPNSMAARAKGTVKVFSRDNFIQELNLPGYQNWKGDTTEVVVLYPNDATQGNYTLTYIVKDKI